MIHLVRVSKPVQPVLLSLLITHSVRISKRPLSNKSVMIESNGQPTQHGPPAFPWFGLDIGGTLVKLVYFEPLDLTPSECRLEGPTLSMIRRYLISNRSYGSNGVRDTHLELQDVRIRKRRGNLHFIRFPTHLMDNFLLMCVNHNFHKLTLDAFVTGGGAYKFQAAIRDTMNLRWVMCDELDTLIYGIDYLASKCVNECYYFEAADPRLKAQSELEKKQFKYDNPYPYLLVNVGTGVSILRVDGQTKYKRVFGSSIGGGTFLGLCRLLTGTTSFDQALSLASNGNSEKVDTLVRDIYGGSYERFNLPGNVVASSFGNVGRNPSASQSNIHPEDLAKSALVTILNNLTSIVCLCAETMSIFRILFVGSFLRENEQSLKLISIGMHYWTQGRIQPIFLEHEGYMGAIGCLRKYVLDNGDGSEHHDTEKFCFNCR